MLAGLKQAFHRGKCGAGELPGESGQIGREAFERDRVAGLPGGERRGEGLGAGQGDLDARGAGVARKDGAEVVEVFGDQEGGEAVGGQHGVHAPVAHEQGHGGEVVAGGAEFRRGDQPGVTHDAGDGRGLASELGEVGAVAEVVGEHLDGGAWCSRELRVGLQPGPG